MRVLISGATGFVGRHLSNHLEQNGHRVDPISRRANVGHDWEPESLRKGVEAADAVVHLAGAGVLDHRWTESYKREIRRSRVETTDMLARACAGAGKRLVSTSAVGYYGPGEMGDVVHEDSPPGDDFLAGVCREWEGALEPAREAGVSVAVLRVAVVLGPDGGALKRMLLPFKLGLGGPIGSGRQPFPWIHVEDLARMYLWLVTRPEEQGVFNAVAPEAVDQRTFARALGGALGRPAVVPLPGFVLRLGLGEGAEMLTRGQHVEPKRARERGFEFEHGELRPALEDLVARSRGRRPARTFG